MEGISMNGYHTDDVLGPGKAAEEGGPPATTPALLVDAALKGGLMGGTDREFAALLPELRAELKAGNLVETALVDLFLLGLVRVRCAAQLERTVAVGDPAWARYQALAERGFWKP